MSAPRKSALLPRTLGLCALLLGLAAAAQPLTRLRTDPPARLSPKPSSQDLVPARDATSALSAEDREVVENLELLENLEQSDNLDLLVELSKED